MSCDNKDMVLISYQGSMVTSHAQVKENQREITIGKKDHQGNRHFCVVFRGLFWGGVLDCHIRDHHFGVMVSI